jgi:hypothetical protein
MKALVAVCQVKQPPTMVEQLWTSTALQTQAAALLLLQPTAWSRTTNQQTPNPQPGPDLSRLADIPPAPDCRGDPPTVIWDTSNPELVLTAIGYGHCLKTLEWERRCSNSAVGPHFSNIKTLAPPPTPNTGATRQWALPYHPGQTTTTCDRQWALPQVPGEEPAHP